MGQHDAKTPEVPDQPEIEAVISVSLTEKDYGFVRGGGLIASEGELAAIARGIAPEVYVHVFRTYEVPKKMQDAAKSCLTSTYRKMGYPDLSIKILLMHDRVIPRKKLSIGPETILTRHKGYENLYVLAKENLSISQAKRLTDKYPDNRFFPMPNEDDRYMFYLPVGVHSVLASGKTTKTVKKVSTRKPGIDRSVRAKKPAPKKKPPAKKR